MDKHQLSNLQHIQEASKQGRLVLFVGAGVSRNSGVPTWSELINEIKKELPENIEDETDDLKIAQLYKDSRGFKEYYDKIKHVLKNNQVISNPIHKLLLDLNPAHIITTNYDDLIEQEINKECIPYSIVRSDCDIPNIAYPKTLIKMHGDFLNGNIVLTENDYYDYPKNFPLIRAYVQSLFASKLVVFVGFSFSDLNLKMLLREIKNILSESMQRVYLISNEKPDEITNTYFNNKGINIVYFDEKVLDGFLKCCPSKIDYSKISLPSAGLHLYKTLYALANYQESYTHNPIKSIFYILSEYKNEIRDFGDGIKYILPPQFGDYWNPYSGGLQLFSKYFRDLKNQLGTFSGKKKFLEDNPWLTKDERRQLKIFAIYNFAYTIDDIRIVDDYFYQHRQDHIVFDSVNLYYEFDFDSLRYRMSKLMTRQYDGTINDLEYPFILYKLGDPYKAYLEYERLLQFAWSRQKYIIYFMALFNMWAIRYPIYNQLRYSQNNGPVGKEILDRLNNLGIENILNNLPLPKPLKLFFSDVISNRAIAKSSLETDELREKIHQQRVMAEKGGWSYNSNILSLISRYEREFQFSNLNYLIADNNQYFRSVCNHTIVGVFNSYATKDARRQTKIEELDHHLIQLLVFSQSQNVFWELLAQHGIKKLKLDDKAKQWITSAINNISKSAEILFADINSWTTILANLLSIISISDVEDLDENKIYNLFIDLISTPNTLISLDKLTINFINKYTPTVEQAYRVLSVFQKNKHFFERNTDTIFKIVNVINKTNETYHLDLSNFGKNDNGDSYALFYPIIDKGQQEELKNKYFKSRGMFEWMIWWVNEYDIPFPSPDFLKKKLNEYYTEFEGNRAEVCGDLLKIRQKKCFEAFYEAIDEYKEKSLCMQFISSPFEFEQKDEVAIEWILYFDKERVIELLKEEVYREKLKTLIIDNLWNRAETEYLISLLVKQN